MYSGTMEVTGKTVDIKLTMQELVFLNIGMTLYNKQHRTAKSVAFANRLTDKLEQ
jgi:hypothetical protein